MNSSKFLHTTIQYIVMKNIHRIKVNTERKNYFNEQNLKAQRKFSQTVLH